MRALDLTSATGRALRGLTNLCQIPNTDPERLKRFTRSELLRWMVETWQEQAPLGKVQQQVIRHQRSFNTIRDTVSVALRIKSLERQSRHCH